MTPEQTVTAFLDALERMDFAGASALVDDAIEYENVGLRPVRGRAAFDKTMLQFERTLTGFSVEMKSMAERDGTVLTERIDRLSFAGITIEPWVCGRFDVRDGRIVLWRDYFDWGVMTLDVLRKLPFGLLRKALALGAAR